MYINEIKLATELAHNSVIEGIMQDNNANVDQANNIAMYDDDGTLVYKKVYQDRFNDNYDTFLGLIHGCSEDSESIVEDAHINTLQMSVITNIQALKTKIKENYDANTDFSILITKKVSELEEIRDGLIPVYNSVIKKENKEKK